MGGLFKAPKPVIVQPPQAPAPAAVVTAATADPDQAASQQRIQAQEMAKRGMQGLIATSPSGVLDPASTLPRKTLLGE
jgi:hypothetical protein